MPADATHTMSALFSSGWTGFAAAAIGLALFLLILRRPSPVSRLPAHFVVVDIETTGLSANTESIIEIAAIKVRLDEANHYAAHAALVDPGREVPPIITQLTGITSDMVRGRRGIDEEIQAFLDFVGPDPLVFYFAEFDMKFLRKAARAVGRAINNPVIDAVPIAHRAFPRAPDHKLTTLANLMGLSNDGAHRALHDCLTTLRLIQYARAKETQGRNLGSA